MLPVVTTLEFELKTKTNHSCTDHYGETEANNVRRQYV